MKNTRGQAKENKSLNKSSDNSSNRTIHNNKKTGNQQMNDSNHATNLSLDISFSETQEQALLNTPSSDFFDQITTEEFDLKTLIGSLIEKMSSLESKVMDQNAQIIRLEAKVKDQNSKIAQLETRVANQEDSANISRPDSNANLNELKESVKLFIFLSQTF